MHPRMLIGLLAIAFSSKQVLANRDSAISSILESRQGLSNSPFLMSPNLGGLQQSLAGQQFPFAPGLQALGGLPALGFGGFPALQGLGGLPALQGFGGLPGLQGLGGLPGTAALQGLNGQGLNGQGLQDSNFLRRFGPLSNSLGNGIPALGARGPLGLPLPFMSPFWAATNPLLNRFTGGEQESLSDLLGLGNNPQRSIRRKLSSSDQFFPRQSESLTEEDEELAVLLQALNELQALPGPSGTGARRLSTTPSFQGGPSFRGLGSSGLLHRSGLESDLTVAPGNNAGRTGRQPNVESDIFRYFQSSSEPESRQRQQDVDTDGYLTFP